jgi:hypothetical protein
MNAGWCLEIDNSQSSNPYIQSGAEIPVGF